MHFDKRINMFGRRLESARALEKFYRENPGDFPYQLLEIEELRNKFREAKEQRKACINPLRREVVEAFRSISEEDVTCFLVVGYDEMADIREAKNCDALEAMKEMINPDSLTAAILQKNTELAYAKGSETAAVAGVMAVGILLVSTIVKLYYTLKNQHHHNIQH